MSDTSAAGVPTCYRHTDRETWIRCQRCERPICPDCMRDAAVGFQCPSCVSEGAKQTRTGRTPYGGQRSANPALTSIVLIVSNVAVWLAIPATGWRSSDLIRTPALTPLGTCESDRGGYYPNLTSVTDCQFYAQTDGHWVPGVADGAVWQLITSAFTHVDIWHIGFNMLALWVPGPQLELAIGRARFPALYFLSALAGSTMVYWLASETGATLGASGAVFGLMGALLVIAFKVGGDIRNILTWIGINAVITIVGSSFISRQAHWAACSAGWRSRPCSPTPPRTNRTQVRVLGLAGLTAVLAVLIVLRTAALA
ncbi:rhomboid family protein [Nocardioides sp. B-3]|uniref:rhomboid family protein n=1 Tax=Nocardioides sp. B-3 TaxID=2895565 RepID=UPI002152099C|nr:rhomboid family intramembrane serine protease [Nocardioides sp. B-3]UUZ61078.1 rhomboid family intramembrane serine protease [Nocardioides sp. B-3]